MARLRYPLLQLLLMTLAVAILVTENLDNSWPLCGITQFCIVHSGCLENQDNSDTWKIFTNNGNYADIGTPPNKRNQPSCERYITMRFGPSTESNNDGRSAVRVRMRDKNTRKGIGMTVYFGIDPKPNRPIWDNIVCKNNRGEFEPDKFKVYDLNPDPNEYVNCLFEIVTTDTGDVDMREKFNAMSNGVLEISVNHMGALPRSKVATVDKGINHFMRPKILCEGEYVKALKDLKTGPDEFHPDPAFKLLKPNENFPPPINSRTNGLVGENGNGEVFEVDQRVRCPPEYPMHRFVSNPLKPSDGRWEPVKDGLICRVGKLAHFHDRGKSVKPGDMIKCARKKCGVCEPPPSVRLAKDAPNDLAPLYEPADDGDKCRTIECKTDVMVVRGQDRADFTILKPDGNGTTITVTCAANEKEEDKKWKVPYLGPSRLVDAKCAREVKCTQLHPLFRGNCTEIVGPRKEVRTIENCVPPDILDNYISPRKVCPKDYDILYVAPGAKNKIRLRTDDFECNKSNGKWKVMTKNNNVSFIPDNSTVHCVMETLTTTPSPDVSPFTGTAPFFVLMAGLALCIVAAIIVGAFLLVRTKKRKAAKKKAMEEVSMTAKERKKKDKTKDRSDRKEKEKERKHKQVSVINSTTGDTNSGPYSQSGSIGTPIAPPSKLLTPSQGVSKPDKGCAVLDLTTGQSKNLRWTNHTGDGPPTKRESWAAEAAAASDSNQEDPQSAIKFAPGEIEAARLGQKKRKERSRQDSTEYKLGDPRPLQTDDSKRAKKRVAENLNESDTMK